ncbi:protein of unknown function [Ruaniaceae bacterium KH17]|nr:protein of unknown function [Ruaniaceae bacterium KH17]
MSSPTQIDPRGPRFGAVITSVLLAAVLILGPNSTLGLVILLIQTVAFALGSLVGLHAQPWGLIFRTAIRPRLGAPTHLEDVRPPRFAQAVGLGFALFGILGWFVSPVLFYIAVGGALFAALLNALFNFCLGCEIYLYIARVRGRSAVGGA